MALARVRRAGHTALRPQQTGTGHRRLWRAAPLAFAAQTPERARARAVRGAPRCARARAHLDQRGVVAQLVDGRAHGVPRARVGVPLRPRARRPPARLQLAVGRAARGLLRGRRRVRRLAREDLQRPRARRAPAAMSSAHHGGRAPCQGGERCLPAHAALHPVLSVQQTAGEMSQSSIFLIKKKEKKE